MNRDEAKSVLLLYRPGTEDSIDPQIAVALAFAKNDAELSAWLKDHLSKQDALKQSFRKIIPPAGLREQIISEYNASQRATGLYRRVIPVAFAVVVVMFIFINGFAPRAVPDNDIGAFKNTMASVALRGYGMDLETNNLSAIRSFLQAKQAPSDFVIPAQLGKLEIKGCAVESWQKGHATMVCFHTGRAESASLKSDLWLFVVDSASVKNGLAGSGEFEKVNSLHTAVWEKDGKIYFMGADADDQMIRHLL